MAFCYVRASVLLESVQRSVRGFVAEANARQVRQLQERVAKLGLKLEQQDRVRLFASMDLFNRHKEGSLSSEASSEAQEEFEDLGKSVRLKEVEKGFEEARPGDENEGFNLDRARADLAAFEREWLLFLEE